LLAVEQAIRGRDGRNSENVVTGPGNTILILAAKAARASNTASAARTPSDGNSARRKT
jgi:hypothetical protein